MTRSFLLVRFWCVAMAAAVAAFAFAAPAAAADWPARDLSFIVPYGPGGSTDPIARAYTAEMEKLVGKSIAVINKPGGSATIGTSAILTAEPDGYTIGLGTNSSLALQPQLIDGLPYRTTDDYQPIVKLAHLPAILTVRADAPWKTFEEFIADAKKNPGKLRASVSGLRTAPDMAVHQLNKAAGVKISTVPFTGGGAQAIVALLGGRVEATVGYGKTVMGHVDAGKLRVLAVFQKGRYDLFPDAYPIGDRYDATLAAMYCVVAPKGLPDSVLKPLVQASQRAVATQSFQGFVRDNGYVFEPKGPQALEGELRDYEKTFRELVADLGMKKKD